MFGGAGSDPGSAHPSAGAALPRVTVSAPESSDAATVSTCAQVISGLPLTLPGGGDLRLTVSTPASPSIVAWGNPAIVLRCGVARPPQLVSTLTDQFIDVDGVLYLPVKKSGATVFTIVDRTVFIDVSVPSSYAQPPLGPIATAVLKVLPNAVCGDATVADTSKLCTRRK